MVLCMFSMRTIFSVITILKLFSQCYVFLHLGETRLGMPNVSLLTIKVLNI